MVLVNVKGDSYLGQLIDEMLQDIELDRRFAEGVRS